MKSITTLLIMMTFFLIVLACSCKNDGQMDSHENDCRPVKKLSGERKDLNISIFLDLSDRISPTFNSNPAMEYWKRDLGYINSISEAFEVHLRNKKTILMNDNIKLFMHRLPENIPNLDNRLKSLDKEFTKQNATLDNICSISDDYGEFSKLIYSKTLTDKEPKAKEGIDDYPGSDIFDFFKSKAKDLCVKENRRNILFIITDGYLYMSGTNNKDVDNKSNYILSKTLSKWGFNSTNYQRKIDDEGYGFQVPTTGLNNLEVVVLGLNPKKHWEIDVLNSYWSKWLKDMGVKNFQGDNWSKYLKKADLPSSLDNLIQGMIHN